MVELEFELCSFWLWVLCSLNTVLWQRLNHTENPVCALKRGKNNQGKQSKTCSSAARHGQFMGCGLHVCAFKAAQVTLICSQGWEPLSQVWQKAALGFLGGRKEGDRPRASPALPSGLNLSIPTFILFIHWVSASDFHWRKSSAANKINKSEPLFSSS